MRASLSGASNVLLVRLRFGSTCQRFIQYRAVGVGSEALSLLSSFGRHRVCPMFRFVAIHFFFISQLRGTWAVFAHL